MSTLYVLRATLKEEYNKNNINLILEEGIKENLRYYENIFNKDYRAFTRLNLIEALNRILYSSRDLIKDNGPFIQTACFDTSFSFSIRNTKENNLSISIGDFGYEWKKEFNHTPNETIYLDFSRYIRLLLKLCKDFTIIELELEIL